MYDSLRRTRRDRTEEASSSLCLLDIDNFKKVNDQHGHAVGDKLLVGVAAALTRCLRAEDRVCRWGGEEFLMLLVNRSPDNSIAVARRLCAKVSALAVEVADTDAADGDVLKVTASIGVAHFVTGANDAEVIRRADAAMYRAKLAGKNRVEVF